MFMIPHQTKRRRYKPVVASDGYHKQIKWLRQKDGQ
jgi:hypothetical protein